MHRDLRLPHFDAPVGLADGRQLGVAEYGDPSGRAVVWFHGVPGARHQLPPSVQSGAAGRGLRVVTIERPGIGHSTNHLYRRVRTFTTDVEQVLDERGVDEFVVVGLSAGGAYAQAVAHQMPERTKALALLCSVAPGVGDHKAPEGRINDLARTFRWPLVRVRGPLSNGLRSVLRATRPVAHPLAHLLARRMPEGDAAVLRDDAIRAMFIGDVMRNSRRQCHAAMNDSVLLGRHWGFDIRDIRVPTGVWIGTDDRIVPPHHGRHLAATIPHATLFVHEGGGHMVGFLCGDEVLAFASEHLEANAPAA